MKVGDLVRWGPFTWDDDVDKTGVVVEMTQTENNMKHTPPIGIMERLQLLSAFQVLQTPSLASEGSTSRALDIIELRLGVRPKDIEGMPPPGSVLAQYTVWAATLPPEGSNDV